MRRLLILVAAAMLPGCSGSGGARLLDPFSRTRVEPPRTGWITGRSGDPYYSDPRRAALSGPGGQGPGWRADPAATALETAPLYQPPGGERLGPADAQAWAPEPAAPGDRVAIPLAARGAPDASDASSPWARRGGSQAQSHAMAHDARESRGATAATSSAVAAGAPGHSPIALPAPPTELRATGEPAGGDRVVGTIQPGPPASGRSPYARASPSVTHTEREPRPLIGSPIDIMDLPPAGSPSSTQRSANSSGVRFASASEEVREPGGSAIRNSASAPPREGTRDAGAASPQARYAYDPEYRWLRGRLEYSESSGRWKLRYISVEGTTDQFGGSVVIANPSKLSGHERGQFVEVHGRLGPAPEDDAQGFAPEFEIADIRGVGN